MLKQTIFAFLLAAAAGAPAFGYICEKDADCPGRQQCIDRECADRCTFDVECGPNEQCLSGHCQTRDAFHQCLSNIDCAPGDQCVERVCRHPA